MGYVTDTPFISEFRADHTPAYLRAVCALNGVRPTRLDQGFTWCDFGCGDGLTACVLAAARPDGIFLGVDFNAEHIARARAMARNAGLTNARFLERDFDHMTVGEIPPLDFAIIHGVLSWLPAERCGRLLDFVCGRLKPGGMLLVGYDALPGWAPLLQMRRRMLAETADVTGGTIARVRAALDWLERQKSANVKFFRDSALAAEWVDELRRQDLRYVAHEFFNDVLTAYTFGEIESEMEARGLSFAGSASFFHNILELSVPQALHDEFRAVRTRRELEEKRDFIRNETFRRDVFVKDATAVTSEAEWQVLHEDLILGTLEPEAALDRAVDFGDIRLSYANDPLHGMLTALAGRAMRLGDCTRAPPDVRLEAARLLMAGGQVFPFAHPPTAETAGVPPSPSLPIRMPSGFNRAMIDGMPLALPKVVLASPVAGSGVIIPALDALLLLGLCEVGEAGAVAWASAWLAQRGQEVIEDGHRVTADAILPRRLTALLGAPLAKLLELGVVESFQNP
ncbi:MAG: class I SAM-dependent methyltransferase [Alphaproteobacteria bacterium]